MSSFLRIPGSSTEEGEVLSFLTCVSKRRTVQCETRSHCLPSCLLRLGGDRDVCSFFL